MELTSINAAPASRRASAAVGGLPPDWTEQAIGQFCTVKTGPFGTLLKASEYSEIVGVPVISVGEVREGYFRLTEHTPLVPESVQRRLPQYLLKAGDVVFGRKGAVDRSALVRQPQAGWFLGSDGIAVRPSAEHCPEYVAAQFQSFRVRQWLASNSTGTTMASMNQGVLSRVAILFPPTIEEERSIAEVLNDADALIDSLEQLLTKKRQIKQGAMQELLTGKQRLPGFESRWQDRPIKVLADVQRGASPRPIDDPVWFDDSSSVGWVRISDVTQSGMYLNSTTQRLSEAGIRKSRFVPSGNLIMSICATVGRPIITELNTCIHDGFVVFDALKIEKKFLYYALLNIEDDWSKHGQTGSQMNLNTGLINGTKIPVPDEPEEQAAIAQVLADMDADIAALEARLAKARDLKRGMAQALLTGRIRLVDARAA